MNHRLASLSIGLACTTALVQSAYTQEVSALQLQPGDHIAIVGNVFADRLQHTGWLETLIYAKYPQHQLVFRNLAAAGDEVATWHRSQDFGSRNEWLGWTQADVIFAFYGFGESFGGYDGIEKFKTNLEQFLKQSAKQNYTGKGAPRIVLFSPMAEERMPDLNFPDPAAINTNLQNYTDAMAEVAKANGVQFVDLFRPSQKLFSSAGAKHEPFTTNGHYLTETGEQALAPGIFQSLFGAPAPTGDFAKLHQAVLDKNWQWHLRYRTIDGYNVYGGRSRLSYKGKLPDGTTTRVISNNEVMEREMQQRDVMTANRDARVWAVAKGGDLEVKDDNLPAAITVGTDLPGDRPDLLHTFLSGEDAIAKMKVHQGMKVNLFADEKEFPELVNPVQMAWDTKGRLWVSAWTNYPERTPTSKSGDKILIFEDTKGTGHADKCTVFLDDLNGPTGFQFYKDGILVMQAPDVWFVRDSKGTGHADTKERVLMGLDSADSHHTTNSMCLEPGGAVYLSDGVFHRSQVETATGVVRNQDAAIYRFEPNTGRFETYASYGFANPHGRVFDYWGNDLITDATGNETFFGPAFSGRLDYPQKHPEMHQFWARPSRPCPGTGLLTSRHFSEEFQGNFLNCNVIGFQGIYRVGVTQDGSGLKGKTLEDLVSSTDPNFRPSQVNVGPDGALYFSDWSNAIIGHMQHHLRDPNRDHEHGRIYRITYEGRPLLKPAKIDGQPIEALLDLLKAPENDTRTLAKIELSKHDSTQVIEAADKWLMGLNKSDADFEHNRLEALWVHQWHNAVAPALLRDVLLSPEPRARAAAVRVLSYWRDRVPDAIGLLKSAARDSDPRVRLQAVRAASFFPSLTAVDVALTAAEHPTDYYLEYTLNETLRELEPLWRKAIADGKPIGSGSPAGLRFLLGKLSTEEMLKLPRTPEILGVIATRAGFTEAQRLEALSDLAQKKHSSIVAELLAQLQPIADQPSEAALGLARILTRQTAADLKPFKDQLLALRKPEVIKDVQLAALAALITAQGEYGQGTDPKNLTEKMEVIPLLADPTQRILMHDEALNYLHGLPSSLVKQLEGSRDTDARYVRIELPRIGTLTLAEVQVFSGGTNIAPSGTATQSSIAFGGEPKRAIDGNTNGSFGSGTQTHTREDEDHPWWQLDLGSGHPIDSVTVWNRTEENGRYSKRLDGFTLTVQDAEHHTLFTKDGIPAPAESVNIPLGGDGVAAFRRAAIKAALANGGDPAPVFETLANLIVQGVQVPDAAEGIRALPRYTWSKAKAEAVTKSIIAWAKKIPSSERTSQDYVTTIQLAGDLADMLPSGEATALRRELHDLRVSVFVVKTVREQMRYDTPRLVVEAGKPFQVIVENNDAMPHNFVIVKPGTREKVGNAAMTMPPTKLDREGRAYIPQSSDILSATKLLEPGQKQTLQITAPSEEGENEYVCTFPGHWMIMWGKLIVTKDVDAYLATHPEAAPPSAVEPTHVHQ